MPSLRHSYQRLQEINAAGTLAFHMPCISTIITGHPHSLSPAACPEKSKIKNQKSVTL
jgi:hypothetical protein